MKKVIVVTLPLIISAILFTQVANAQFSGTSPATLNGSAKLNGSMLIGSTTAALDRRLNINKTVLLSTPSPTFTNQTTGIRINHNQQNDPGGITPPYTMHKWDIACNYNYMHFRYDNTSTNIMYLSKDRKVGIGTIPDATFHVKNFNGTGVDAHLEGFTLLDGSQASLLLGNQTGATLGEWGIEYNHGAGGLNFWKPWGATANQGTNYHLFIKNDGKVSIGLDPTKSGTFNGSYKLYVANGIMTERVKVALKSSSSWADYVFNDDYELKPLIDVQQFILKNKHLPDVPSADDLVKSGYDVTTMDATLLQKIEELTLYVIKQEQHINKQQKEIDELRDKLNK